MRRVVAGAVALLAAALAAAGAALPAPAHTGGGDYSVDAVFDTAAGLIPQNNVMIAGAKVGTVTRISLTAADKALVHMRIARRYGPFHADARCQIRPVALIGEMEVNCDPGTASTAPLRPARTTPPTVPLRMTTVPVDLTDLFDIWSAPVSQRVSVVLWTLGAGLAGRGADLNGILERSNPTLMLARQTIGTLDDQRTQLQALIDASDRLLGRLAPARATARRFIGNAADVATLTATHAGSLAESVRRLPALLDAARPALAQLNVVADTTRPVLAALRTAAPNLDRMLTDVVPLVDAATPAVHALSAAGRSGLRVLPSLTPLAVQLRGFAHTARPVARLLAALFTNMQARGFVEGLNDFPYYVGSSLSRFDATSHLSASNFLTSGCGGSSESGYSACSAKYGTQPATASARRLARARAGVPAHKPAHRMSRPVRRPAPVPAGRTAPGPGGTSTSPATGTLQRLIGYLLR